MPNTRIARKKEQKSEICCATYSKIMLIAKKIAILQPQIGRILPAVGADNVNYEHKRLIT